MNKLRQFRLLLLLVVLLTVGCDQASKHVARVALPQHPMEFFGGVLTLVPTENPGAFLSLGAGLSDVGRAVMFLACMAGIGVAAWVMMRGQSTHRAQAVALALIVGGGAGNMIDRLARGGRVFDFIYLQAGPLHTGVFNVADIAITAGAVFLVAAVFWKKKKSLTS